MVFECGGLHSKSSTTAESPSSSAILPVAVTRRLARALLHPSRMRWHRELELALLIAVLALAACGGVKENAGADGSTGSGADAGDEPGSDAAPGDDQPAPDAAPPGACRDGVTPLLANGGFEQAEPPPVGALGWVEDPSPATYPEDQIPVEVPEGRRAALIGSAVQSEVRLTQTFQVPETAESLTVSGLTCVQTEETGQTEIDTARLLLLDDSAAVLEELASGSNLDADGCPSGWTRETIEGIEAHAGEALQLQFLGTFSDGQQTSFYFDDVSLDALGPCPE
jgi:hypothetical protein